LLRQALAFDPAVVRIFSRDESKQFDMQHEFAGYENIRFLLGDVRDKERLLMAMDEVDLVFHAAALKHVLACEYNPFEAVKTNIYGTQNVIEAALEKNVERVIMTSSDKAVNPANTMGASKLMAEKLITAANHYKGSRRTVFASVRFGNVLGSRGSVVPLFKEQIRQGGPVTLTHENMTRFIMALEEAVGLVFKAAALARGGEVFVLKMPAIQVADLARVLVEALAPAYGFEPEQIKVNIIGSKPGEKLYEELISPGELNRTRELEDMYVVLPAITELNEICGKIACTRDDDESGNPEHFCSTNGYYMTRQEIHLFLKERKLI
jgi:FlaA1/EpsC-like NDP-sugar epimerase